MTKAIKFVLPWLNRQPGYVDTQLGAGVMDALVLSRRAVWHEIKPKRKRGPYKKRKPATS